MRPGTIPLRIVRGRVAPAFAAAALIFRVTGPCRAGIPFFVDDPGTVDPGCGTLFVAAGYSRMEGVGMLTIPAATLTCGFDHALEAAVSQSVVSADGADARAAGFGDLTLTPKWRFFDGDGVFPDLAVAYAVSLPTGSGPAGGDATTHNPYMTVGRGFGDHWQLFGQAGAVVIDGHGGGACFQYGVAVSYGWGGRYTVGLEFYGRTRGAGAAEIDVGLAFGADLDGRWSLMANVAHSVAGPAHPAMFAGPQLHF